MSTTVSGDYRVVKRIETGDTQVGFVDPTANIHPQAIVDPSAVIEAGVEIGPWTLVGPNVTIGEGTVVHSHVVIKGPTTIGKRNQIFQFSTVGEDCQDKKFAGEPTQLIIGDNNVIREGCTLHRGTTQDQGVTQLGSNNLLMVNTHIAHDCVVGDNCILANNVTLAGHVHVGNGVILGGHTAIHQFCRIGSFSMCAGGSKVLRDVPAFVMADGYPAIPRGMNTEGMRRRGYSSELISTLRNCYKILYRQALKLDEAIARIEETAGEYDEVQLLLNSIKDSPRGIVRP